MNKRHVILILGWFAIILGEARGVSLPVARSSDYETDRLVIPHTADVLGPHLEAIDSFVWSPTHDLLLYRQLNSAVSGPGVSPYDLILLDPNTGKEKLLSLSGHVYRVGFSTSGGTIGFWQDGWPYVLRIGDVAPSRVALEHEPEKGDFAPSMRELVYVDHSGRTWLKNISSNTENLLTTNSALTNPTGIYPEWSTNENAIVFVSATGTYLLELDTARKISVSSILSFSITQLHDDVSPDTRAFTWHGNAPEYSESSKTSSGESRLSPSRRFVASYIDGEVWLLDKTTGVKDQLTHNSRVAAENEARENIPMRSSSFLNTAQPADGFDFPVGKPDGNGYNITAGCGYLQRDANCGNNNTFHPGRDINDNGACDSDLDDPVYSIANGTVVETGNFTSGTTWGRIVLIEHRMPDSTLVWSQYAHLSRIDVTKDQEVGRGQQIGQIGKGANSAFCAHLHFEVRTRLLGASNWPTYWTVESVNASYTDPWAFVQSHRTLTGGPAPRTECPQSGFDIIFYYNALYDCGDRGSDSGWVGRNGTGWQNMPGGMNDQASSLRVRAGWSVKVFQDSDRHNNSYCYKSNDDNFTNDWFDLYTQVNDKTSSFEVFADNRCGEPEPPPPPCAAPGLNQPGPDATFRDRTITFSWNDVSCSHNGWTFRVKTDTNMDDLNGAVIDTGESGTSRNQSFGPEWDNRDLYWSVRATNAGRASVTWATPRHFKITPNNPPSISFPRQAQNPGGINTTLRDQDFSVSASDSDGSINRIEWYCADCDNQGNGAASNSGNVWSLTRTGMDGKNLVRFRAFDNLGADKLSEPLEIRIDRAPPNFTEINVIGTVGDNGYYRSAVNVRVKAQDGCTGRACVGGERIEYTRDGGGTQTSGNGLLDYTETNQGSHSISFRALDALNNATAQQNRSFIVDSVAPSPIGSISEASGSSNNVWQRNSNVPVFNWAASTDATSGVARYQLRLVDSEGRVVLGDCLIDSSATRECRPTASGLRTGTYMLRGRVQDLAGNWSTASNTWADWPLLYTFKYDNEAPQNPASAGHQGGAPNNTWQRTTSAATFTFTQGGDGNGSGVAKYYVYWGDDPAGESVISTTSTSFAGSPLCTGANTCVGYLRVRTEDAVGNLSAWVTLFTLRYDNAPPVADMLLNNGVTSTAQTLVQVSLAANDGDGSGVKQMRISKRSDMREDDGIAASAWVPYTATATVLLPAISKQAWPVYLQVADGVNLLSAIVSRTVYLDVNAHAPRSSNFWLLDGAQVAGGGIAGSANYSSFSTLDWYAGVGGSSAFSLTSGFAAGSTALPITEPVAITYTFMSGVFGSGNSGAPMSSTNYNVQGVLGELGVPNNVISLTSVNYSLVPGFMALLPLTPTASTPITNTPPPTLTEVLPSVGCEFSTVSINNGALFTGRTAVTLSLCSPRAVEMKLSNDGGFAGAQWRPFISVTNWVLDGYGTYVVQRTVRAAFRDADGHIITGPSDDIIYDPLPPTVNVSVSGINGLLIARSMARGEDVLQPLPHLKRSASGTVDLLVLANEDNSGVDCMELSESLDFSGAVCQPYAATLAQSVSAGDGNKTIYVRMRDLAGNISSATASSFVIDSEPPQGGMALADRVVGPNIVTTTLYLGADDSQSGVTDVRVGELSDLSDAVWQVMTPLRSWPVSTTALSTVTVYAQFRDAVGNLSPIYTDLYVADNTPPERFVEVRPGIGLTRTVTVLGYDALSSVSHMRLSNDSRMLDGVTTLQYATATAWVFDERRVVWVQLRDGVGNWSEPYPAYAADVAPLNMTLFLPAISR